MCDDGGRLPRTCAAANGIEQGATTDSVRAQPLLERLPSAADPRRLSRFCVAGSAMIRSVELKATTARKESK